MVGATWFTQIGASSASPPKAPIGIFPRYHGFGVNEVDLSPAQVEVWCERGLTRDYPVLKIANRTRVFGMKGILDGVFLTGDPSPSMVGVIVDRPTHILGNRTSATLLFPVSK